MPSGGGTETFLHALIPISQQSNGNTKVTYACCTNPGSHVCYFGKPKSNSRPKTAALVHVPHNKVDVNMFSHIFHVFKVGALEKTRED